MAKLLNLGRKQIDVTTHPLVMGILNVTPDSFSDGGSYSTVEQAVEAALSMVEQGADIIDIGGESTRPGSEPVPPDEESDRVIPVIEALRSASDVLISIDTTKASVARLALAAKADILNDISGLTRDPDMPDQLRQSGAPAIIMHSKGTPAEMQKNPHYDDLFGEICSFLAAQAKVAEQAGAASVIIDPGIGFGKTLKHNLRLIATLKHLTALGYPVLLGPSRKSFIGKALGLPVDRRLEATLAAAAIGVFNGADIVRVHDVRQARQAVDMAAHLRLARTEEPE